MASEVEQEICGVTGTARFASESEQAYLGRLVKKLDGLPDSIWEKLSAPAKEWSAAAALATNQNQPIPRFNGPPAGKEPKVNAAQRIRELLLENPKLHSKDIHSRLVQEGFETNYVTVQVNCGHFREAMKFFVERGLLKLEI